MLPDDTTPPAADAAPAAEAAGTEATGTDASEPIGFIAGPVPVPVAPRPARRSTVLAVAMVVVALLGGGALFMSGYSLGRGQGLAPGTPASEEQAFKAFWDAYHAVRDQYALGPVDTDTLVEGAIKGMVEAVGDPYSTYLTPEDYAASLQDISGQFEGIGTEIGTVDSKGATVDCNLFGPECRFIVNGTIAGSPAEAAGLKAGDIVVSVDGATIDGLTPDQVDRKSVV